MGIVFKQSIKNVLATYLGFAIGGINTLFLFTHFLSKEEYGLVSYVLSTATILTPLVAFGVHNTMVRYYSSFTSKKDRNQFTLMMLCLPLIMALLVGSFGILVYQTIVKWLSSKNEIVSGYVPIIYFTAIAMAYFEVFYAWARVHFQSVGGNFIKEVFHRVGICFLLFLIYLNYIDFHQFMFCLLWIYVLRSALMLGVALYIRLPKLQWGFPSGYKKILIYSLFIILSGSVSSLLIDIDKFMLNQYVLISNIAIYNVAVFVATVIVIPYRAMYQIISPITADFINKKKKNELETLYRKSTINVYLAGMIIFLLIVLNANQLYALLPSSKGYEEGIWVLILMSIVKLSDTLVGINNAILFNSPYYRNVLYFGLFLVFCMIGLNIYFIPKFGINGAAIATLLAFLMYNALKLIFVYKKYNLHPFSKEVLKTSLLGFVFFMLGFFWDFHFTPIINIILKSSLILLLSLFLSYKLQLSKELMNFFQKK